MSSKYSAKVNIKGSGTYTQVYTEADSQTDAERIFKMQYPGHDVLFLQKLEEQRSSASSNSGCAGVVAAVCMLPAIYFLYQIAA